MKNCVLIIDAQNDFCNPNGALYVKGAEKDMQRLTKFLNNNSKNISRLVFTKDMHPEYNISIPEWFKRKDNDNIPMPFTSLILNGEYYCGKYLSRSVGGYIVSNPEVTDRTHQYVKWLNDQNLKHFIWPKHCIAGTSGSEIVEELKTVHIESEIYNKGTNPLTHPFSAITDAEPSTTDCKQLININLIRFLGNFDNIFMAGEARNFCVLETMKDLLINSTYPYDMAKKIVIIEDCMSDVPGFENESQNFNHVIKTFKLRTCKSDDII